MKNDRMKVYKRLARLIDTYQHTNQEWCDIATDRINKITDEVLPSGSGLDAGCIVDLDKSTPNKIVIETSFHHMNDVGYYTKWTDHTITITPSLSRDYEIKIGGRDYKQIKDYIWEVFDNAMKTETEL